MTVLLFANNASSNLATNISSSQVSIALVAGYGAGFPSPVAGQMFKLVLENQRTGAFEVCDVTSRSGDTLTVVRGSENTTPSAFLAVDTIVQLRLTKETMEQSFETSQGLTGPMGEQGIPGSSNKLVVSSSAATRNFTAADVGKIIRYTSANPGDVWTMPADIGIVGDVIEIVYRGDGQDLTISATGGAVFRKLGTESATTVTFSQLNARLYLRQIATDDWSVDGTYT